jgi:putative Holliday junction resolvase
MTAVGSSIKSSPTRVLGIDYGSQRIGLALSDPLGIIAQSYDTLANTAEVSRRIAQLVVELEVNLVVVGMPYNLKGERGQKAREVEDFVERLRREMTVDIVTWDERFTSRMANATMMQMGTRKKERRANKGRIDAMAAALMLQSYLDSTKRSHSC